MRYIKDLREGEIISEIYLCKSRQTMKTKAGKTYYSLVLQDKTGTIDGKIWDLNPGIQYFEALQYIRVDGQVSIFQNNNQLNIRKVRVAQEGEYDPAEYLPCSPYNNDQMYAKLLNLVESVQEPHLHALLESFFVTRKEFVKAFRAGSAAKTVHHGFVGGLLQHTLSVAQLCDYYASQYPLINRDLLITAALCHDIGKVYELSPFPANDYTDSGQLLGHIVTGVMMVRDAAKRIEGFPPVLARELEHCIISHHGEMEYGSPKKPALIEAMALHLVDLTDARIETMTELIDKSPNNLEWIGYNRFLETNVRRTSKQNPAKNGK